jgi:hypothetical protein
MTELIIYALLFVVVMGHAVLAYKMYNRIHLDQNLKTQEKNDWKFKALLFPAYFWSKYKQQTNLR